MRLQHSSHFKWNIFVISHKYYHNSKKPRYLRTHTDRYYLGLISRNSITSNWAPSWAIEHHREQLSTISSNWAPLQVIEHHIASNQAPSQAIKHHRKWSSTIVSNAASTHHEGLRTIASNRASTHRAPSWSSTRSPSQYCNHCKQKTPSVREDYRRSRFL